MNPSAGRRRGTERAHKRQQIQKRVPGWHEEVFMPRECVHTKVCYKV